MVGLDAPGGIFPLLHAPDLYENRGFIVSTFSSGYRKWDSKAELAMIGQLQSSTKDPGK